MNKPYNRPLTPEELATLPDEEIDFSDIAELDEEFWANAKIHWPECTKKQITIRLDADMLDWFRSKGRGYQTRMNAILRSYYEAHRNGE